MSRDELEMQEQREDARTSELLASLRDAELPAQVRDRIVEGAMAKVARRGPFGLSLRGLRIGLGGRGLELGLAAAMAAVALGVGLHLWAPDPLPATGSLHASQEEPSSFKVGAHEVLLSPASEVEVVIAEPRLIELSVASGSATFDVAPLSKGDVFRVRTDQVLVEVVGTRFSVESRGFCSLVTVEEGLVRVSDAQGEVLHLKPNQGRRFCERGSSDSLLRQALVTISRGEAVEEAIKLLESYLDSSPGATLEEEALYHLCLAHARLGEAEKAQELAERFRQRFPQSARLERLERGLATLR